MIRYLLSATLLLVSGGLAQAAKESAMQTQCFGRFEMQIPTAASIKQFAVSRGGVALSSLPARSAAETETLWRKDSAVQSARRHAKAGSTLVEARQVDHSIFALAWYDSHASQRLARVRLYYYADDRAYVLEQPGTNESRMARTEQLQRMTRDLRPQPDGGPGLCFDGGFLAAAADSTPESVQASVVLAGHPDVQITIDTTTNNGELPEQLSARLANSGIEREPSFAQVKKLFDERRTVNGMTGHAAGYKVPTTASILAHRLAFQVLGSSAPNTLQPEITLLLKSGEQRDDASYPVPSVSDEEASALFDRLVSSLRLRPSRS